MNGPPRTPPPGLQEALTPRVKALALDASAEGSFGRPHSAPIIEASLVLPQSQQRHPTSWLVAALCATLVVFSVDLFLPLGIAGGVPYLVPVLLSLWIPGRRSTLSLAGIASALTLAGLYISPAGGVRADILANRSLALFAIWVTSAGVLVRKRDENLLRLANRELTERQARLRAVLDTAVDAVITIDETGTVESFNGAAERMFDYDEEEVVGRNVTMLMPSPTREQHDEHLAQRLRRQGPSKVGISREVIGLRRSGEKFPLEISLSEFELGDRTHFTGILRDQTERKRADRERERLRTVALQSARLADVGGLVSKIVHDLGNPVAGLTMQAQLIQRCARRGAPIQDVLQPSEDLLAVATRLRQMIEGFRDFARQKSLAPTPIDVAAFLEDVQREWSVPAAEQEVGVELRVQPDLPDLQADEGKLRRVLDNLVKNAIEAMPEGGRVMIDADQPKPGWLRLSVADDGTGIEEGVNVFRLFETTKPDGTGVGLSVCREMIRAHGGDVRFESRKPRGTVFLVELPMKGPA